MKERQILHMVYQHYPISETEGAVLDFRDLMDVKLRGDDLRRFLNDWGLTLAGMKSVPEDTILESMFRVQIENYPGLREQMAYYERLKSGHADKEYQ